MVVTIALPQIIDDGRIDIILKLIGLSKKYCHGTQEIKLDWGKTGLISPAGLAILACLFDTFIEQKNRVKNIHISKKLTPFTVIENFKNIGQFSSLPGPDVHNFEDQTTIVRGKTSSVDLLFTERLDEKFSDHMPEELLYAAKLTINELMQNSVDHSTSERYYLYAGLWQKEFHIGLLDMGITIPAKLEQKYIRSNDLEYLELSMEKGSSTRRIRTGGFGLYYFFEFLKESRGKLTIVSRLSQIRRYFKTRKSQKNILKYSLPGTWCFARFPLEA